MLTHTGEELYQCKQCENLFSQKVHTGENPYLCSYCYKAFKQKRILSNHQRIHTAESAFSIFILEETLMKRHIRETITLEPLW